jgi:hypothetical protein
MRLSKRLHFFCANMQAFSLLLATNISKLQEMSLHAGCTLLSVAYKARALFEKGAGGKCISHRHGRDAQMKRDGSLDGRDRVENRTNAGLMEMRFTTKTPGHRLTP